MNTTYLPTLPMPGCPLPFRMEASSRTRTTLLRETAHCKDVERLEGLDTPRGCVPTCPADSSQQGTQA